MSDRLRISILASFGLILAACSGGGGGGGSSAMPEPSPALQPTVPTATVGVLLTDAGGRQWDQAWATITSIELIGDTQQVTLFSGRESIDLLSLTDYSELFTVAEGVAPGAFTTIRLLIEQLELVDLDSSGVEKRRIEAKLIGDGRIDVSPREPFTIAAGDVLLVEIDFDMHKSFKTLETSNGETILRPVVFATVKIKENFTRLTRIAGTIDSLGEDASTFVLCQTALAANYKRYGDDNDHDDDDDDDNDRHCIDVTIDDATGVFDADGLPVTSLDLLVGDELTAVGFLRRDDDADDNDDSHRYYRDDLVLDAVTLELGDEFGRFSGVVESAVAGDLFDFTLAPGQGFEPDTLVATQLFPTTRVFSAAGVELDQLSIVPGVSAIVDGIVALDDGDAGNLLRAALIVIDTDAAAPEEILRGEIISVAVEAGTFQLLAGTMDHCVNAQNADIFLLSEDDGLVSERGELADLVAGQRADVYGAEGIDGCFVASDVLVDARE